MPARILLALTLPLLLLPARSPAAAQSDDLFSLVELRGTGRTVAAEIGDFDGDGRADLLQIVYVGFPPDDKRFVRLWKQTDAGGLADKPAYELPLPEECAAYDIGDVLPDSPGLELILLRSSGLTILSFASPSLATRELRVDGPTIVAAPDERGLDRLEMVYTDFGREPWLMVPMLGQIEFVSPTGKLKAKLDVGARANYFVQQRPGPLLVDSDVQLLLDVARLSVGDVDGDGRADVVSSRRADVRVFLQREGGTFPQKADKVYKLALVSEQDFIRGSGAVRSEAADITGDGKLDLLISHLSGGITDAKSDTRIYLNHDGGWKLDQPDFVVPTNDGWGADQLVDIDHDGKAELLHVSMPFGVLDVIRALITRSIDADVSVYRASPDGTFAKEPWFQRKLSIAFSFDTARPQGFVPTGNYDLNGDGYDDLVTPGKGERLDVWLGGPKGISDDLGGRQIMSTSGRLRSGDWNGDGLADLVLYDPRIPGAPLSIATNRGLLPGTLPHVGAVGKLKPTP